MAASEGSSCPRQSREAVGQSPLLLFRNRAAVSGGLQATHGNCMPGPCLRPQGPAQAPWFLPLPLFCPWMGRIRLPQRCAKARQVAELLGPPSLKSPSTGGSICARGLWSTARGGCGGRVCLDPSAMAFSHLWLTEQKFVAVTSHQDRLCSSEQDLGSQGEGVGPDLDEAAG